MNSNLISDSTLGVSCLYLSYLVMCVCAGKLSVYMGVHSILCLLLSYQVLANIFFIFLANPYNCTTYWANKKSTVWGSEGMEWSCYSGKEYALAENIINYKIPDGLLFLAYHICLEIQCHQLPQIRKLHLVFVQFYERMLQFSIVTSHPYWRKLRTLDE